MPIIIWFWSLKRYYQLNTLIMLPFNQISMQHYFHRCKTIMLKKVQSSCSSKNKNNRTVQYGCQYNYQECVRVFYCWEGEGGQDQGGETSRAPCRGHRIVNRFALLEVVWGGETKSADSDWEGKWFYYLLYVHFIIYLLMGTPRQLQYHK